MALASVGLSTHILNNRLKSGLLLLGFPVLLILMVGGFFGLLSALSASAPGYSSPGLESRTTAPNISSFISGISPKHLADGQPVAAFGDGFVWGVFNYGHWAILLALVWFTIAFFGHAGMMRMATGSKPITRVQMPKIYNMLENLCISRGIPMPQFEVIDSPALNAFATGINEKTYKIVLTRGIIDRLADDELEAVIGHELSHIMNRDVQLLIISVVFVGMISFFTEMVFRMLVHGRRPNYYARGRKEGGGQALMLGVALVILAVGYIFAIVIRFALSRKREYLADAGSVELTKNPDAMMRALLRISGNDKVSGMPDEVQQMCIENSHPFMGLFATHPSISDRVRVLSEMTGTPAPEMQVSLRRGPRKPWGEDGPKEMTGTPVVETQISVQRNPRRPWGERASKE